MSGSGLPFDEVAAQGPPEFPPGPFPGPFNTDPGRMVEVAVGNSPRPAGPLPNQHGSGAAPEEVPRTQDVVVPQTLLDLGARGPNGTPPRAFIGSREPSLGVSGGVPPRPWEGPSVATLRNFYDMFSGMVGKGGGMGGKGGGFGFKSVGLDERYFRHIETFKGSSEKVRTFMTDLTVAAGRFDSGFGQGS